MSEQEVILDMPHMNIKGYLLGGKFRNECLFFCVITFVILSFFLLLIWYDLLLSQSFTYGKCIAVIVISFVFMCVYWSAFKSSQCILAKYECSSGKISNTFKKKQYTIILGDGCLLTKIPISFFLGKSKTTKTFYLVSKDPIYYNPEDHCGVNALSSILCNGAVLLPCEDRVVQSYLNSVQTSNVPDYPYVMHIKKWNQRNDSLF